MTMFEVRLSCLILGAFQLIWSAVIMWDDQERAAMLLDLYNMREFYSMFMLISGTMLVLGAVWPVRKIRHIGLWTTPMIAFPTFGLLTSNNMTGALSFSLPLIGIMALVVLFYDSMRKPRRAAMDH